MERFINTEKTALRTQPLEEILKGLEVLREAGRCINKKCGLLWMMWAIHIHSLGRPVDPERMLSRRDYEEKIEMPMGVSDCTVFLKKSTEADGEYFEHLLS